MKEWNYLEALNVRQNGENVLHLGITEVVLVHCNTVDNDYQQNSRVLYIFLLINHLINYRIFHPNIEVRLIDQTSKLLEKEDKISITLVINEIVKY